MLLLTQCMPNQCAGFLGRIQILLLWPLLPFRDSERALSSKQNGSVLVMFGCCFLSLTTVGSKIRKLDVSFSLCLQLNSPHGAWKICSWSPLLKTFYLVVDFHNRSAWTGMGAPRVAWSWGGHGRSCNLWSVWEEGFTLGSQVRRDS